jgi:hypothetical protein
MPDERPPDTAVLRCPGLRPSSQAASDLDRAKPSAAARLVAALRQIILHDVST